MDLISHNSDDGYINLPYPSIIAAETSQKDYYHLSEAMQSDGRGDFMKATENKIKNLTTENVWEIFQELSLPTSAHIIRLI